MQKVETIGVCEENVNYDESPIAELEVGEIAYRLDTGQGSAVAISQRPRGTWRWTPITEGRWDGRRLHAKRLDYEVVTALAKALGEAMRNREEFGS